MARYRQIAVVDHDPFHEHGKHPVILADMGRINARDSHERGEPQATAAVLPAGGIAKVAYPALHAVVFIEQTAAHLETFVESRLFKFTFPGPEDAALAAHPQIPQIVFQDGIYPVVEKALIAVQ